MPHPPRSSRLAGSVGRGGEDFRDPDAVLDPEKTLRLLSGAAPGQPPDLFPPDVVAAAQLARNAWTIPAAITLAQWALESDWGKAMPPESNNPFGIKAIAGEPCVEAWTHEFVDGKRIEVRAKFRKFASMAEAFDQHGRLLATAAPYAHARTLIADPDAFADALTGVYATAPDYGQCLKRLMKDHNLYQYDQRG